MNCRAGTGYSAGAELRRWTQLMKIMLALLAARFAFAGAVEFGQAEFDKAAAARGLTLHIATEVTNDPPDSFQITTTRISGGDPRDTPLKTALPGKSISVALTLVPLSHATTVRLHYRAVNQLTPFKTLEAPSAKAVFTIPADDEKEQWDLMYYFEVLNAAQSGWFEPDPKKATPYFVVNIAKPGGRRGHQ